MKLQAISLASAAGTAAAALAMGGPGVVPNWPPTYNMTLSTIVSAPLLQPRCSPAYRLPGGC
jgi:hypothetical protein